MKWLAAINNYDFLSYFGRLYLVHSWSNYSTSRIWDFYHIQVRNSMHYISRNNLNPQIQQDTPRIWTIKNLKIIWCKLTVTITIPFVVHTKNNSIKNVVLFFFYKYNIWNIFFISLWIQIVTWAVFFNHFSWI